MQVTSKLIMQSVVLLSLTGCAQVTTQMNPDSRHKVNLSESNKAARCCSTLSQVHYQKVGKDKSVDIELNNESPVIKLLSGYTYIEGVEIPESKGSINIELNSLLERNVLIPSIMLLDDTFKVVRIYDETSLKHERSGVLYPERYTTDIEIDLPKNQETKVKYLAVYTTDELLSKTTTRYPISNEALWSGDIDANIIEQNKGEIPHSETGVVSLNFEYDDVETRFANEVDPRLLDVIPSEMISDSALSAVSKEEQYKKRIRDLIQNNQYEQAVKLVKEADELGLSSVGEEMLKAIQSK